MSAVDDWQDQTASFFSSGQDDREAAGHCSSYSLAEKVFSKPQVAWEAVISERREYSNKLGLLGPDLRPLYRHQSIVNQKGE